MVEFIADFFVKRYYAPCRHCDKLIKKSLAVIVSTTSDKYYFCDETCTQAHFAQEQEDKESRRRPKPIL